MATPYVFVRQLPGIGNQSLLAIYPRNISKIALCARALDGVGGIRTPHDVEMSPATSLIFLRARVIQLAS
jgi:hypothetical protein